MRKVIGYTCKPLNQIIESTNLDLYPAVTVHLCNSAWRKECKKRGCGILYPQGQVPFETELRRILKKKKLSYYDITDRAKRLKRNAYKKCRKVVLTVKEF